MKQLCSLLLYVVCWMYQSPVISTGLDNFQHFIFSCLLYNKVTTINTVMGKTVFSFTSIDSLKSNNDSALVKLSLLHRSQLVDGYKLSIQSDSAEPVIKTEKKLMAILIRPNASDIGGEKFNVLPRSFCLTGLTVTSHKDLIDSSSLSFEFIKRHIPVKLVISREIANTHINELNEEIFVNSLLVNNIIVLGKHQPKFFSNNNVLTKDYSTLSFNDKVGLDGIEVSDDGQYLWAVNQLDGKLYRIEFFTNTMTPVKVNVIGFAIPKVGHDVVTRCLSVKSYGGRVYVSVVSIPISQKVKTTDWRATLLAFDSTRKKFEIVSSISFSYINRIFDYGVSN